MIRFIFFVLYLALPILGKAQVITTISDTAVVGKSWKFEMDGDTNYWIKSNPQSGKYIVYFDATKKQIALSVNYYSSTRYDLYGWYRNGQQKIIDLNVDSLPYYRKNYELWNNKGQHIKSVKFSRDSCINYSWLSNGHLVMVSRSGGKIPWREDLWEGVSYTYVNGVVSKIDEDFRDSIIIKFVYADLKPNRISVYYPDKTAPNGARERIRATYYENGQIMQSVLYPEKGRQAIIYYYESGKIKEEGEWENGNIGNHREYFEDGKIKAEGEYVISEQVFHNDFNSINYYSTKSGHWIYYNEEGKIVKEEWYSNTDWNEETIIKYKTFDKNGKVETEGENKAKKLPN
jgi:antitoxin component YwqK of YwqJK toxin-antitoxin module